MAKKRFQQKLLSESLLKTTETPAYKIDQPKTLVKQRNLSALTNTIIKKINLKAWINRKRIFVKHREFKRMENLAPDILIVLPSARSYQKVEFVADVPIRKIQIDGT